MDDDRPTHEIESSMVLAIMVCIGSNAVLLFAWIALSDWAKVTLISGSEVTYRHSRTPGILFALLWVGAIAAWWHSRRYITTEVREQVPIRYVVFGFVLFPLLAFDDFSTWYRIDDEGFRSSSLVLGTLFGQSGFRFDEVVRIEVARDNRNRWVLRGVRKDKRASKEFETKSLPKGLLPELRTRAAENGVYVFGF